MCKGLVRVPNPRVVLESNFGSGKDGEYQSRNSLMAAALRSDELYGLLWSAFQIVTTDRRGTLPIPHGSAMEMSLAQTVQSFIPSLRDGTG